MSPFTLATIIIAMVSQLSSCSTDNNSISNKELTREERMAILNKVILSPSKFTDCDYDLFQTGGFDNRTVHPMGPTDYDYKFVVKISHGDAGDWTKGMEVSTKSDEDKALIKQLSAFRQNLWKTHTEPKFFKDQYSRTILYEYEGIIFKHFISY